MSEAMDVKVKRCSHDVVAAASLSPLHAHNTQERGERVLIGIDARDRGCCFALKDSRRALEV